jgi:hypothetical protein
MKILVGAHKSERWKAILKKCSYHKCKVLTSNYYCIKHTKERNERERRNRQLIKGRSNKFLNASKNNS